MKNSIEIRSNGVKITKLVTRCGAYAAYRVEGGEAYDSLDNARLAADNVKNIKLSSIKITSLTNENVSAHSITAFMDGFMYLLTNDNKLHFINDTGMLRQVHYFRIINE